MNACAVFESENERITGQIVTRDVNTAIRYYFAPYNKRLQTDNSEVVPVAIFRRPLQRAAFPLRVVGGLCRLAPNAVLSPKSSSADSPLKRVSVGRRK